MAGSPFTIFPDLYVVVSQGPDVVCLQLIYSESREHTLVRSITEPTYKHFIFSLIVRVKS